MTAKYSAGLELWTLSFHTPIREHESDLTEGGLEVEWWARDFDRGDIDGLADRLCHWGHVCEGPQRGHLFECTLRSPRHFICYSLMVGRTLAAKARQDGFILTAGHPDYESTHRHFLVNNYSAAGVIAWANECQKEPIDYIDIAFRTLSLVFYQDLVPQALLARAEICWGLRKLKPELTVEAAAERALADVGRALDFARRGGWLLYQCDGWSARVIISLERSLETEGTPRDVAGETIRTAAEDWARALDVVHGRHPWQSGDRDGYHRRDVDLLYVEALLARAEQRLAAWDGAGEIERNKAQWVTELMAGATKCAEESGFRIRDLDLKRVAGAGVAPRVAPL